MRIERDVKDTIKELFDGLRAWWFMYVPVGYGKSGVPDFIACVPVEITEDMVGKTFGMFVAPEAKFGTDKPSEMQAVQMRKIREAGGISFIVNEENVTSLRKNIYHHIHRKCKEPLQVYARSTS